MTIRSTRAHLRHSLYAWIARDTPQLDPGINHEELARRSVAEQDRLLAELIAECYDPADPVRSIEGALIASRTGCYPASHDPAFVNGLNGLTVETEDEHGSEKCVGEGGHFWVFEPPSGPDAADAHYACERCSATGFFDKGHGPRVEAKS